MISSVLDIYVPSVIDSLLAKTSISLKKRFGQNFLTNRAIAEEIVGFLDPAKDDVVVEVGPGLGALTFILSSMVQTVIAVEIDRGLVKILQKLLNHFNIDNVKIVNEDFLRLSKEGSVYVGSASKMIGNLPYASGQKIVINTLEKYRNIKRIVATLQKEAAGRITASPGKKEYGFVSAWVQYLAETRVVRDNLAPGNFYPVPEVFSSVLLVDTKPDQQLKCRELEKVKRFLKCCFSSKRKSLVNNLVNCPDLADIPRNRIKELVESVFKNSKVRAEELDFMKLLKIFTKINSGNY